MNALAAHNLTFAYPGGKALFSNLSLCLNQGECVALTGPSGCGKSTLCYLLAGIIPRNIDGEFTGQALVFGRPVNEIPLNELVQQLGIVLQIPDSQLFSPTVEDELAFGPENLCLSRQEMRERIDEALALVGMEEYRLAHPDRLSGGQKQLIALAAVLTLKPQILIFDEALSQLDDEATARVKTVIADLKKQGKTILMVEHDPDNLDIADRIYSFENGFLKEAGL
ncbi:MAG: ABC transporter ATP-binding protein [Clostridia bacterium]|nr:ABC transporter ATP-binding protein [Clostridia bacterium]MDD4799362.1 ABC transporter ATP-binding protein [Clostridia bacterium]